MESLITLSDFLELMPLVTAIVVSVWIVSRINQSLAVLVEKLASLNRSVDRLSSSVERLDTRTDEHDRRLLILENKS